MTKRIKVFETTTGYLVQIGNSVFEMNDDADLPNGVDTFYGDIGRDIPLDWYSGYKRITLKSLPIGVRIGIKQRGGKL